MIDFISPLLVEKNENNLRINMLLITEKENNHYTLIKDESRLLSSSISKDGHKMFFCLRCFNHFTS